ncbi:uncharacterized protein BDR25DRAFT_344728 [Lindgomyces ingoldianus]|uniref:Uncharacterized protein n=1 Tax=Lindgomyces ingoldianus TaxID=673940 RepID=A0ACB6QKS1_9PLEO|nr:uncharacterized protein BDR25DRAFT_344728 [Lindgomyces ingoldianus]KAF2467614.1 hypothetical protein BDR25DRAFT_344728 [Lindgomyces ingoldianus]
MDVLPPSEPEKSANSSNVVLGTRYGPPPADYPMEKAGQGRQIFRFSACLFWCILAVSLYTIATLFVLIWAFRGPQLPNHQRVFRTGNLKVNQFFSGMALSALLTPAAILSRKLSYDFMSLHPFAIAARRPVRIGDLDRMVDFHGVLVPIGTLMITTGTYAPPTPGHAVIGIPTFSGGIYTLSHAVAYTGEGPHNPSYGPEDQFLAMIANKLSGDIMSQTGFISSGGRNTHILGPISTANITYKSGVEYKGIVTFKWNPNCSPAREDISYHRGNNSVTYFTFPNGTVLPDDTAENGPVPDLNIFFWSNASSYTSSGIPLGGTTFFALNSNKQANSAITIKPTPENGLDLDGDTWISRVKCTPILKWQISSCTFNETVFQNCTETPNSNTTALDVVGLDALEGYMTAVPWSLYNAYDMFTGMTLSQLYNALSIDQYESILSSLATGIVAIASAGYFGTATVPTVGEPPRDVYIARLPIVAIILVILISVVVSTWAEITYCRYYGLPFRRTTFLTIANAVRGQWWDEELHGGCVLRDKQLRRGGKTVVQFGVDAANVTHVGLAPQVFPIQREKTYYGVGVKSDDTLDD